MVCMEGGILGARLGAIGRILLLRLLLDGLLEFMQNIELLELRVRGHWVNLNYSVAANLNKLEGNIWWIGKYEFVNVREI
jgi:hypothetical protein